jgi:hypothetical protein
LKTEPAPRTRGAALPIVLLISSMMLITSASAPQCLAEAWRLSTRPEVRGYLLTARRFGRTLESQAWVQLELVVDGDKTEQHWRRVTARPF